MSLLIILIISISLSMDTFSLSLAYGTLNIEKKQMLILSLIVGIFHFFMPLIGIFIGELILKYIHINSSIIVFLVLSFIGLEMIVDSRKKEYKLNIMSNIELIVFAFVVSLDSFSVGIGLKTIYSNYIICSLLFLLFSSFFTYFGLLIGKKINNKIGKISTFIGGLFLIIIGIFYLI